MWWLALPRFFRLIGGCCCSWWWRQILSLSPAGEIIAILSHPGGAGDTLWPWLQAIDLKMLQVHPPLRRVSHTLTCGSLFCLGKLDFQLEWGWFMGEIWRGWPPPQTSAVTPKLLHPTCKRARTNFANLSWGITLEILNLFQHSTFGEGLRRSSWDRESQMLCKNRALNCGSLSWQEP